MVTNITQMKGLTHFLCFPLFNQFSRPILRESFAQLRKDTTPMIPENAFRPLGTLHITMGSLSLGRPELFADFTRLLSGLNLREMLKKGDTYSNRGIQLGRPPMSSQGNDPVKSCDRELEPITVNLSGIVAPSGVRPPGTFDAASRRLATSATDLSGRLGPLWAATKPLWQFARGNKSHRKMRQQNSKDWGGNVALSMFSVSFVDSPSDGLVKIPSQAHPGKFRSKPGPTFDARKVIEQYNNKVWAKDVRIDRLSICRLGLTRAVQRDGRGLDSDLELCEEFSIPLS